MYQDYYQLKENPFNVTADPDFFFKSKYHNEAISSLMYGISQRKGIMVVTGEVGTGKTTLCRKLVKQVNEKTQFAFILNPKFSESQLLQMILQDLAIPVKYKDKFNLVSALNNHLLDAARQNINVVIIVDEAQNLSVSQLEQVRLLSNLETEKAKLLQIILVGQTELQSKLKLSSLRQLRQRIAIQFNLVSLDQEDIKAYIYHRLDKARGGDKLELHFTDQAIDSIYHYTQGIPRMINLLCDRALLAGFVVGKKLLDELIIENCAKEVFY